MERTLDIHQTITLAPPPPSGDAPELDGADRRNTPVGGDTSSAHIQAALAASTRTEAGLNDLMRSIQELARGVGGARQANEHLVQELETLREMLGSANEQQLALRNRLTLLEQERHGERKRALVDQSYLTEQYDAFLSDLLDDHEQATDELRRERDEAQKRIAELEARLLSLSTQPPPSSKPGSKPNLRSDPLAAAADAATKSELLQLKATVEKLTQERERTREALQRLQAQRDEAQAQAAKAVRERDAALAGAGEVPRPLSARPKAVQPALPPRPSHVPLSARPTDPPPAQPAVTRRPVLELELDVGPKSSPSSSPPSRASKPPLRQKPDPTSRPLIGYSLTDAVAPESLGSSPRHSKPPKT